MRKYFAIAAVVVCGVDIAPAATLTWVGATNDLSLDSNWSPATAPFADDVIFNASATTKLGLDPGGPISVNQMTVTGSTYSFAASAGGDAIGIGAGTGALNVTAGASLNFSDQAVTLNDTMTWTISGNSSVTSSGTVDTTDKVLTILYGASQTNVVSLNSLVFGTTGALSITNWGGSLGVYGGANNQLRFAVDPSSFLSKIAFVGYPGSIAATQNMGSFFEVVPAAIPEPQTWLLLAGGLTTLLVLRRRRSA